MAESDKVVDDTAEELYDPNNPAHIAGRKTTAGRKRKLRRQVLEQLMSHAGGRDLIWEWLSMCGVHRSVYNDNPIRMAFNEGQRNIGLAVEAAVVQASPKFYTIMIEEHSNG